jgi:hypothetical protein
MKIQRHYPLGLIYPLGPPEGLRFSACLKIRFRLFPNLEILFSRCHSEGIFLSTGVNAQRRKGFLLNDIS